MSVGVDLDGVIALIRRRQAMFETAALRQSERINKLKALVEGQHASILTLGEQLLKVAQAVDALTPTPDKGSSFDPNSIDTKGSEL